jgi:uncharacterized phiE125 gp8 family phage protein
MADICAGAADMQGTVRVVTAPAGEPVTLAEAKAWCRIDSDITVHDSTLNTLISAMRRHAELKTGRAYIQRTLELTMPGWPDCLEIYLPQPPLVSVTSVKYYDEDGADQTLATDQYVVHDYVEPAVIVPAWEVVWPTVRGLRNAVRVRYVAGYPNGSPDLGQEVPATLRQWMQARIATLFDQREQIVFSIVDQLPHDFADGLLDELVLADQLFG